MLPGLYINSFLLTAVKDWTVCYVVIKPRGETRNRRRDEEQREKNKEEQMSINTLMELVLKEFTATTLIYYSLSFLYQRFNIFYSSSC